MIRKCPNCGYEEENTAFIYWELRIICPHCGYDILNLEFPPEIKE